MRHTFFTGMKLALACLVVSGCTTAPETKGAKEQLGDDAATALNHAQATDPTLPKFLLTSTGYAVFPRVGKGAAIVGGSYGRGVVYQSGEFIGYADITQATVGLQAGGQEFNEIVVFESAADVTRFKSGKTTLAANLSAVALKTGASESAQYTDGVAVFVEPIGGLMVEAAVGGQQFTFQAK